MENHSARMVVEPDSDSLPIGYPLSGRRFAVVVAAWILAEAVLGWTVRGVYRPGGATCLDRHESLIAVALVGLAGMVVATGAAALMGARRSIVGFAAATLGTSTVLGLLAVAAAAHPAGCAG